MHPLTTDLAQQILALVKMEAYSLLGAIQDGKTVLGGSAGSGGGTGEPPAGFVGQLAQSNVTFDTAGSSRACSAGSAGSSSLVGNLDAIRLGLEICDDAIGDRHVDWGTGAGQVSAVDVPFATTSGSIDATNVRDAIEETYAEGGGAGGAHTLLSGTHSDTDPAAVQRGDLLTGGSVSKWERLAKGTAHQIPKMNSGGTDIDWVSFDWDNMSAGSLAGMVHDHSSAAEGGTHWGGITQTYGGITGANIIVIPDDLGEGLILKDSAGMVIATIVTDDGQPAIKFNPDGEDIDIYLGAGIPNPAIYTQGSDGLVRMGAYGAGLLQSDASGWISTGGSLGVHNLLSANHGDTTTDAPTEGSIIRANATPAWDELPLGAAYQILRVDGVPTTFAWTAFDWTEISSAAGAFMVHSHGTNQLGGQNLRGIQELQFDAATTLTISGGVIARTQGYHEVDTTGGSAATDDLDTIGGVPLEGDMLIIRPANDARTIVVKHQTGNIWLTGKADISLDDVADHLMMIYNGSDWCEL